MHIRRKGGEWWALISEGNYQGGGNYRLEIRRTKLGFQVWFDHAPASDYIATLGEAAQELKLLDAEERLDPSARGKAWDRKSLKKAGAWSMDD